MATTHGSGTPPPSGQQAQTCGDSSPLQALRDHLKQIATQAEDWKVKATRAESDVGDLTKLATEIGDVVKRYGDAYDATAKSLSELDNYARCKADVFQRNPPVPVEKQAEIRGIVDGVYRDLDDEQKTV